MGCSVDGRVIWGFWMVALWFVYISLGLHILICKIRSLNLMMILAFMFHDDDNKFNTEQQFWIKAGLRVFMSHV